MADSGILPLKGGYYLWKYLPSLPAAAIFVVLFAVITAAHGYKLWKSKLWRLCIWLVIGGLSLSPSTPPPPRSNPTNLVSHQIQWNSSAT